MTNQLVIVRFQNNSRMTRLFEAPYNETVKELRPGDIVAVNGAEFAMVVDSVLINEDEVQPEGLNFIAECAGQSLPLPRIYGKVEVYEYDEEDF